MFSLESPHRGDSNENTQYTIFNIKKKRKSPEIILNLKRWDIPKGPKNDFETAMVNKPPLFEPLKFYCKCFETVAFKLIIISTLT